MHAVQFVCFSFHEYVGHGTCTKSNLNDDAIIGVVNFLWIEIPAASSAVLPNVCVFSWDNYLKSLLIIIYYCT